MGPHLGSRFIDYLGGGNSNMFGMFTPNFWEDEPKFDKRAYLFWFNHSLAASINSRLEVIILRSLSMKKDFLKQMSSATPKAHGSVSRFPVVRGKFWIHFWTPTRQNGIICLNNFSLH